MLSIRESRFVDEYLIDCNGTRAAVAAGYAAGHAARVQACRLLARASIQEALEQRRSVERERLRIDRQAVLDGLLEAISGAKLREDPGTQIAGWREVAKLLGLNEPARAVVSLTGPLAGRLHAMEAMSDAELLALSI